MSKVEDLLYLMADMERAFPGESELSSLIAAQQEDELDLDQLDMIAAAASRPDFSSILERGRRRKKKPVL